MRLFLDANVLFTAAHNPKGKAALVIGLGVQGRWTLFSSTYAKEEARRNLEIKFPQCLNSLETVQNHIRFVDHQTSLVYPKGLAKKDQPIFQAALICRATHLLTGDIKDFGRFMNQPEDTFNVCIQTVADFLSQFS